MLSPKTIFLVEDDRDDERLFAQAVAASNLLQMLGTATDGQDAIEKLKHFRRIPDLIFMDIMMPKMNGIECLLELKRQPRLAHIPVIMISTTTVRAELAYRLGAKGFIRKPSSMKTFKTKIERAALNNFLVDADRPHVTFQQALTIL